MNIQQGLASIGLLGSLCLPGYGKMIDGDIVAKRDIKYDKGFYETVYLVKEYNKPLMVLEVCHMEVMVPGEPNKPPMDIYDYVKVWTYKEAVNFNPHFKNRHLYSAVGFHNRALFKRTLIQMKIEGGK